MEQTRTVLPSKTPFQAEKDARDLAIFNEYNTLTAVEGQSKTVVIEHLMKKYNIHSVSTIYVIRERVEAKLKKGGDYEK